MKLTALIQLLLANVISFCNLNNLNDIMVYLRTLRRTESKSINETVRQLRFWLGWFTANQVHIDKHHQNK